MSNRNSLGILLVVLGFVLLALTGIRTVSNPDIFTHIALGQAEGVKADPLAYTMNGQKWINMHPLYNNLVHALWKAGGAELVTLTHTAVVLAAFLLMLRFAKDWGGPLSRALALLLCTWLMAPVFNPSPSAFFMLFTALFLVLLYRLKNFNLLAALLLVLQVLWTNIHPSFLFGPFLILFFAIENWQETRAMSRGSYVITPLTTRLFGLTAAALLVTLINPNLINLHRHIIANWLLLTGNDGLEWISLFSSYFPQGFISSLTVLALILGACGMITLQAKLPGMLTTLALIGAFLTVRSVGSLHLFAFLAFPFLVLSFSAISGYLSRTLTSLFKTGEARLQNGLSVLILVLMLASLFGLITNGSYIRMGSASRFGLGVQEDAFPSAVSGIIERKGFPERILNLTHDGGYLALQNPDRKIFCDTRRSFYGSAFLNEMDRALLGQPDAWKSLLSKWNPHAVVLNAGWPDAGALANRLIASQAWKMIYMDGTTVLLVRNLPDYQEFINDPAIQKFSLSLLEKARQDYARSGRLFKPGNPSRLIGAGSIYLALNRPQEAEVYYKLLTNKNPVMAGAWMGLGQSLILQKQISKGTAHLEKAAKITPRNSRIWMSLFQAYRLKGDEEKARDAADQLAKFFKAEKATVEQQQLRDQKRNEARPQQKKEVELELPTELQK